MSYLAKVLQMAETYISENKAEDMHWSWGEALVMYTLSLLDEETGDKHFFDFYKKYADTHYKKGVVVDQSDTCAPALITHKLFQMTGDVRYKEMTDKAIHYLKHEPRLVEDLINHNGHSHDSKDYPKSIWVDSLMMSGVFGSITAADTGDEDLLNFALKQPAQFAKYLQDEETKIYHHSWWKILNRPYPRNIFWGRGNGWVIASFALMYEQTKNPSIAEHLKEIASVLLSYQREDHYFDTVVNKPGDNYRESSATALIAAGWMNGIRNGVLGEEYRDPAIAAYKAVVDNFEYEGEKAYMTETSLWTIPMFIAPYRLKFGPYPGYKYVKKGRNVPYGVASLIMAATEYEKLMRGE